MPITAVAADNSQHIFPDGTDPAVIDRAMKAYAAPSLFNNPFTTGLKEAAEPMATGVQGIGDLMGAGMRAVGIPTRDTSQPLPHNVTVPGEMMGPGTVPDDTYKPTSFGGKVVEGIGQFAPSAGLGPEGILPKAASVVFPALGSETVGSVTTNPYARALGGLAGAGVGGLATRGATALANILKGGAEAAPSAVDAVAPTISDLHKTASANYKALDDPANNPIIKSDKLADLVSQVRSTLADWGFHPANQPQTARLWNTIKGLPQGKPIQVDPDLVGEIESIFGPGTAAPEQTIPPVNGSTLKGLETVRQQAVSAGKNFMTSDGQLANKVKGVISKFMSDLDPEQDIAGTEATGATTLPGVQQLNAARNAWATMKKAQTIQSIIDNADIRGAANYTQAGADTAVRRGFANLATNAKKMAQFTPDEQDAIKLVAQGGTMTNAMRFLGKFAVRGPVSGMATHVVGNLMGPMGPYMLAGAGEAAKAGAAAGTGADVEALQALIRGGPEAQAALAVNRRQALVNGLGKYAPALAGATALAPSVYGGQ